MPDTVRVPLGDRSYDVVVGSSLLGNCAESIGEVLGKPRLFVLFDEAVALPWAQQVMDSLSTAGFAFDHVSVPSGEKSKSVAEISRLWEMMAQRAFTRDTTLVAVGGGVIGDLGGFLAGSYLRGIPFVQIPTTLLAMVDSSVGGKTGINLQAGKNLVGAFWQPALVLADIDTLSTLPIEEFRSGMAEVIKYGVIRDPDLFSWLEQLGPNPAAADLTRIVHRSVQIKAEVVSGDERETTGLRAILNFGHTLGHAIEAEGAYSAFRHGEAIAIGMVAASLLALKRETGWSSDDHSRLEKLLKQSELPTSLPKGYSARRLIDRTRVDKKAVSGQVRYILPTSLGSVKFVKGVDENAVLSVLHEIGAAPE